MARQLELLTRAVDELKEVRRGGGGAAATALAVAWRGLGHWFMSRDCVCVGFDLQAQNQIDNSQEVVVVVSLLPSQVAPAFPPCTDRPDVLPSSPAPLPCPPPPRAVAVALSGAQVPAQLVPDAGGPAAGHHRRRHARREPRACVQEADAGAYGALAVFICTLCAQAGPQHFLFAGGCSGTSTSF